MMNVRGQAMIQTLVAVAIMGVIIAGSASMMNNQSRQTQTLNQKLARLDVYRVMISLLQDGSTCSFMVTNPASAPFDPMTVGTKNPPKIKLNQIPTAPVVGAPAMFIADGIKSASPAVKELVIKSMEFRDLECSAGACTPTSDLFKSTLFVDFDGDKLNMPLAPLQLPVILKTAGTPNAQTVTGCAGDTVITVPGGPTGIPSAPGCSLYVVPAHSTLTVEVWGGGAGGAQWGFDGEISFFGPVIAKGGVCSGPDYLSSGFRTPVGGDAIGGDTNTKGEPGIWYVPGGGTGQNTAGNGGDSPSGGAGGRWSVIPGPTAGGFPGGGGAGGMGPKARPMSGGGAGAYAKKVFKSGELPVGSLIPVCVGAGGRGSNGGSMVAGTGGMPGGDGKITVDVK